MVIAPYNAKWYHRILQVGTQTDGFTKGLFEMEIDQSE